MKLLPSEAAESAPPSFDLAGLAAGEYVVDEDEEEAEAASARAAAEPPAGGGLKLGIVRLGRAGGKVKSSTGKKIIPTLPSPPRGRQDSSPASALSLWPASFAFQMYPLSKFHALVRVRRGQPVLQPRRLL